jgi:hypothetical protein
VDGFGVDARVGQVSVVVAVEHSLQIAPGHHTIEVSTRPLDRTHDPLVQIIRIDGGTLRYTS